MPKAVLKTKETDHAVDGFVAALVDEDMRHDCREVIAMMGAATGAPPRMWGSSTIGFGQVKLTYRTGREVEWFRCGFSPRKGKLSLYLSMDIRQHQSLLDKLGKHKTGKGCLYLKRLADVDQQVLMQLVKASLQTAAG
ncbi:MAG: DUF1801 domain-containing protein [Bacteroidetes bacterium]|nr:DUF1801 domain-containing protein [Bacteroidota bacterium]MBS1940327.1 DUF1801 domain-containing protein [Bacteroidota bacterium]